MFLKALTLKGFKSFADPTVLEMEPGVTVVVGPNGSGKSNVVDAVAWVLGAQAPSSVRSQKMEDVIFNGTKKRPALGRAEVMLTLDNSAGLLPLDFNEVTISRTLFRNGDSEYAINGVECRLLDVQELLSDAGVGRQQHVIISQGQIDAVLTARAEDRREIIEEAAGVLKYRKRKEKAERRLQATEANLLRVQDLIREVRRQLRPLERQAEAARRHEEVMAELRALRMFLSGREIASLRARLTALASESNEVAATDAEIRRRLASLDTEVLAAEAELSARGDSGLSDELVRVEQLRERARGLSALLAERRRGLERDQGQMMADDVVASVEADVAQARAEFAEVERGLAIATGESEQLASEEAAFEREREEKGLFATVPSSQAAGAAAEVRGELRTLRNAVEQSAGEIQRLQARIEQVSARDAQAAREADSLQRELADAENAVEALRAEMASLDVRHMAAEAAIDVAQEGLVAAERSLAQRSARVESLASVDAAARARSGSRALAGRNGILGALIDLVEIDNGWDAAVRAALGDAVGAVLVADPSSARAALAALRESGQAGAVLALGVPRPSGRGVPAGTAPLRERVRPAAGAPAELGALLDSLLDGYGFAEDIDDAVRAAATGAGTVVTRAGDRLGGSAWRVGAADELGSKEVLDAARRDETEAMAAVTSRRTALDDARRELTNVRLQVTDTEERLRRQNEAVEMAADSLTSAVSDRRAGAAEQEAALLAVDEAYVDLAGTERLHGDTDRVARELKRTVRETTRLTISVGGGSSKLVAKIASGASKPDGLLIVPSGAQRAWLAPRSVGEIPGIGPVAQQTLRELGITTCGQLADAPDDHLLRRFGPNGPDLKLLAIGEDDSPVDTGDNRKSLSRETTLDDDIADPQALETLLLGLVESVSHSLRHEGLLARTVTVKLKDTEFRTVTRQAKLQQPSDLSGPIFEAARALLQREARGEPYRLIGVSASDLGTDEQLSLFDTERAERERAATRAADAMRAKYGDNAVTRARLVEPDDGP